MVDKNYRKEVLAASEGLDFAAKSYQIVLETSMGGIVLDLFTKLAPEHCKNMLGLAEAGFYDNLTFHRVVAGFVIQAGCPQGDGTGGPGFHVRAEFNARPHKAGVVSMARAQHPDSAGSQFFICLDDIPMLDGQYSVFGQTADAASLEVVQGIGALSTDEEEKPLTEVLIKSARICSRPL